MAIEAKLSSYKKNNLKIAIVVLIVMGAWFAYDGYFNSKFIDKHTDEAGNPDSTLVFNQKSPFFFAAGAVAVAVYFFMIKDRKVTADETKLTLPKQEIPYDSIEKIDKTHFDDKGFFIITYKDVSGNEKDLKLSDRGYDNLRPILEKIVEKIS